MVLKKNLSANQLGLYGVEFKPAAENWPMIYIYTRRVFGPEGDKRLTTTWGDCLVNVDLSPVL
jgi:hypothetical protein